MVSGTAPGADRFGEEWAKAVGLPVRRMPADGTRLGRSAGMRRNEEVAKVATDLVAVWDGKSPGTKYMIEHARSKGLRVFVWLYIAQEIA